MISVKFDFNGTHRVQWPRRTADILALGQAYIAHESSLPVGQQLALPNLAAIQAAYTAAQNADIAANNGEIARAGASEAYRQTLITAKRRLDVSFTLLKLDQASNLARLEEWGLDTVSNNGHGVKVRKPRSDRQWEAFLDAYVAKESSLPPAEQIADPSLAEISALQTALQTAKTTRTNGRNQRELNTHARTTEVEYLLDLLQLAALNMVVTRHSGVVLVSLQSWGYDVVTAVPPPPIEIEPLITEPAE